MTRRRLLLAVLPPAFAIGLGSLVGHWMGAPERSPQSMLWSILLAQVLWGALAISGAALATGADVADRLGLRRGRLRPGRLAVAVVGFIALSNAFHLAIELLALQHAGTLGRLQAVVSHSRGTTPWLPLLALGLAPGICEELLFRGFVQRIVSDRAGAVVAVLTSALVFGVAHWDPIQSTAAFGLGLYLGMIAELADSTRATMLCHVVNNTLGVSTGLLWAEPPEGGGWLTVIGLSALALACLAWSVRHRRLPGPARDLA